MASGFNWKGVISSAHACSVVWLFVTPWTIACQAQLCMGFPRQEYSSGLPFPSPGALPDPGIQPTSPALVDPLLLHHLKPIISRPFSRYLLPSDHVLEIGVTAFQGIHWKSSSYPVIILTSSKVFLPESTSSKRCQRYYVKRGVPWSNNYGKQWNNKTILVSLIP